MERPLTSWKEIATHFNKSVRTVQRWEQQFGLPVRRPDAHDHGIVLAFPSELDSWLHAHLTVRSENGTSQQAPRRPVAMDATALTEYLRQHERSVALIANAQALAERVKQNSKRLREIVEASRELHRAFGRENTRAVIALTPTPTPRVRKWVSQSAAPVNY